MAHFFLSGIYGNRTYSGSSGFTAGGRRSISSTHTRGWNVGIEVDCYIDTDDDGNEYDRLDVYMTPGSSGPGHRVLVGQAFDDRPRKSKRGPRWVPARGKKNTKS